MRYLLLGVLALCVVSPLRAQTIDPQLTAPITKFVDAFNRGDMAGAAATHAADADLVIIDEVSPFVWRGAQALKTWSAALEADSKKHGMTDQKVTLSAATRAEVNGSDAYVVVPAVYSFTEAGVAKTESAHMTFVLKKGTSGWLIHGWTWTGPSRAKAQSAPKKSSARD
jgi:ketosteroid isomerase-like protein